MIDDNFWQGKRVFLTGHTGFKGSWLSLWLHKMGAQVAGYALDPPTDPSLFELAGVNDLVHSSIADVRDLEALMTALRQASPDIVIHMAAQPLVRDSYKIPVETYSINVMGTVHLLEAVRHCRTVRAVVNITTDKCYENKEWYWGYRENEPMGGYDPYSNSKGCSELVTSAYRNSYFNPDEYGAHGVAVATARAGNVIGGGDWATDRLVCDCVRSLLANEEIVIRNPQAIRPWQHVLEPLSGYLMLAQRLFEDGAHFAGPWNFGPDDEDARPVEWIVRRLCDLWGGGAGYSLDEGINPHESTYLKLDCSKAKVELGWAPRWSLDHTIESIVKWIRGYRDRLDIRALCLEQIQEYEQKSKE